MHEDLLRLARELVPSGRSRPKEVKLRRALSCAYYAMFHALARMGADTIVGPASPDRTERAWRQAYRSLNHGGASKACEAIIKQNAELQFPDEVTDFARQFPIAKSERQRADYDPAFKPRKGTVLASIAAAEVAIACLQSADARQKRAFVTYVLLQRRR